MVSAFRRSLPHGAHSHTTLSQLHGVLSNAGAVKDRDWSSSTARDWGDPGGEGELDGERCLYAASRSGSGALLHVLHRRRYRARMMGVAGGFMVQFYTGQHFLHNKLLSLKDVPDTRQHHTSGILQPYHVRICTHGHLSMSATVIS